MASYQPPSGVYWTKQRLPGLPVLTIYINPQLSGVIGTLNLVYAGIYYPVFDLPPSEFGLIVASVAVGSPESDYVVVFPAMEVEGVLYQETESPMFNLTDAVTIYMNINPIEEPEPEPEPEPTPTVPYMELVVPIGVGTALILLSR